MKLFGEVENYVILLDEDSKFMEIDIYGKMGGYAEGVLATHVFTGNSMRLSESLRDQVGLKLALEFLDEQNVPADHPLRYLGRGWDWLPK